MLKDDEPGNPIPYYRPYGGVHQRNIDTSEEVIPMADQRNVEIFSAGCPICGEVVQMVREMACESCDIHVLNVNEDAVAQRASDLGVRSVPAVAIDGTLASCCTDRGVDEAALQAAGIGQPLN